MKQIVSFFIWFCCVYTGAAQPYFKQAIHSGEICHNFTTTEFFTQDTFKLYQELEEGKPIYLFLFETTSPLSFAYHNSGVLQTFYNTYGPAGTNEIHMIAKPSNCICTSGAFDGTASSDATIGNWLENMSYPLVNGSLPFLFPQKIYEKNHVLKICPDRRMLLLDSFPDLDELVASLPLCDQSSEAIDAKIVFSNMDTLGACPGEQRTINAYLCNMGSDTLTSCEVIVSEHGQVQQRIPWSGSLATYQLDTISLANLPLTGHDVTVQFFTRLPNGQSDQNPANDTLSRFLPAAVHLETTDSIDIEVQTDYSGEVLYWDVKSADGVKLDWGGANIVPMVYFDDPYVPSDWEHYSLFEYEHVKIPVSANQCYVFRALNGYGLGTCCILQDGFIKVRRNDELLYEFKTFGWRGTAAFTTKSAIPILHADYAMTPSAVGLSVGSITVTPSDGVSPYEYSMDCGETFVSSAVFENLSAGWYCITTRDATGFLHTDSVQVTNVDVVATSYAVTHETDGQANGSIVVTAVGGVPPYDYSKDCGETFGTAATFGNLSEGWYCMHTRDAVGQVREDSVYVDNIVGTQNAAIREVALRPNPTRDVLQVSITAGKNTAASLSVVNAVGQVIWQQNMSLVGGQQTVTVPTATFSEGVYWLIVHDNAQTVYQRFVVLR